MDSKLPTIALLSLGGTIGARVDARGRGASLKLGAADLLATIPTLAEIAIMRPNSFRTGMSANLSWADLVLLSEQIAQLASADVDGVVVTQGTDTIEETAYMLDLLSPPGFPVVVTGAMRNPGKPGDDGAANLVAAVRVASSADARGMGCLVVLDDTIHMARFARKSHTFATGSFVSTRAGPVGFVVEDRVRIPLRPRRASPHLSIATGAALPDVALLTMSLGDDERLIPRLLDAGYQGLVVESFGAGHVRANAVPLLERLAQSIPVILASRTGAGELYRHSGSYPGSEGDLLGRGLISAVGLDGPKARVLLTLLLATGATRGEIATMFEEASS
jgi:L-asparaginase